MSDEWNLLQAGWRVSARPQLWVSTGHTSAVSAEEEGVTSGAKPQGFRLGGESQVSVGRRGEQPAVPPDLIDNSGK